jgi:predicted TIM-barrel fold metal-dependent hydrolase
MNDVPSRVVDCHVHLWDPARTDWYPYLSGQHRHDGGAPGAARMNRRFDVATYRNEAAGWPVAKIVNVAAATGRHSVEETLALDAAAASGHGPDAVVGGLPPTESVADAIDLLDRQMAAPRFRGVRPMGPLERPVPDDDVLRALGERGLVFELMAHPDHLASAAGQLAGVEELTVVVEHTGWPRTDTEEERALWRAGMAALAELGERVVCKLSGLAMPLRCISAEAFRPWIEHAIERFGVDRCMFASNFPVDSMYGTFDDLYGAFSTVTAGLDAGSRHKLFAANAERVYRLAQEGPGR